ncbi:MAG: hypothetical protein ACTSPA_08905 [Promethearchaeota archaeon]
MGLGSSYLFFDLENNEVFVNYQKHLSETSEFDTHTTINSKITELTNTQDSTRYNTERLKKLLAFL